MTENEKTESMAGSASELTTREMEIPAKELQAVFGAADRYVKKLEDGFGVSIVDRNGKVLIKGKAGDVQKASNVFLQLVHMISRGNEIEDQNVDYAIEMGLEENEEALEEIDGDVICHTVNGKPIKPKTVGQKAYVDAIRKNMIVFGLGPAGTGKTYLAMAMAITAFKKEEVNRIILTRPAIEAGEKLGFRLVTCKARWIRTFAPYMTHFIRSWARKALQRTWKRD